MLPLVLATSVYFADSDVLHVKLIEKLCEVKPTLFVGVPRIWEKFEEIIKMEIEKSVSFKRYACKYFKLY